MAGARGRLLLRLRRLRTRWHAFRMPAVAEWRPPANAPRLSPQQQRDVIAEACRVLDALPAGDVRLGAIRGSIGIKVRGRDGTLSWLKIVDPGAQYDAWARDGELSSDSIVGVPKPKLLREFELVWGAVRLHALQFTLAPSPVVLDTPWIVRPLHSIDDRWLDELKRAIDRMSELPLTRWLVHPGRVARVIRERFGQKAPHLIDEWRTAHGDLNWSNLTAPHLMLLDWERWGAAPRGFDAATLLAFSFQDPDLFRRIQALFAHDLDTPTGVVARLYQYAQRLASIEAGIRDPRHHQPIEAEAKRLLRL